MRKLFFVLTVLGLATLLSCKKTEVTNPLADFKNLGIGSYITLDSVLNLNFAYNTPESKVGIQVSQYASDVDSIVLFVVEGASGDPSTWRQVKKIKFNGPRTEISATELEVATALGITTTDMAAGNFYTFYNRVITKDRRVFDLSNTPGALEANSNYNTVFRWTAYITCPFTGGMSGLYTVIQDDWEDWAPGDVVTVTDGPGANQVNLSQVWPNTAYGSVVNPLIVNVDPATGTATVPPTIFGNYGSDAEAVGADGGVAGYVFSCTGFITLNMNLKYNGAPQGSFKLILKKN